MPHAADSRKSSRVLRRAASFGPTTTDSDAETEVSATTDLSI